MISNKCLHEYAVDSHQISDTATFAIHIDNEWPMELKEKAGEYQFDPFVTHVVEDVHLGGPAQVGFKDNDVILDTAYANRLDVLERNSTYYNLALQSMTRPAHVFKDPVFSMTGVWSGNYFHWITEWLPRLQGVLDYEKRTGEKVTILCQYEMTEFQKESLSWLLGPEHTIISLSHLDNTNMHVLAERLIIPTTRRSDGRMHPSAAYWLYKEATKFGIGLNYGNYYLTRKDARTRRVVNEYETRNEWWPYEIDNLQPEKFPWLDQVGMFNYAKLVIGPHGSGFANIIFSKRAKVIELMTPAYVNPCIMTLAAALGFPYRALMCDPVGEEDMKVNHYQLREIIQEMK